MGIVERFFKYMKIDTRSERKSESVPSTKGQITLLRLLCHELEEFKVLTDLDEEHGILYACLPANNVRKNTKSVGFITHVDTSPDASGKDICPRIIEKYDGKNITLNQDVILKVEEYPEILAYQNKSLIVTDGTTLLGADDKAGISEVMTMVEYFVKNPEEPHGEIWIAFTSDEEIGRGTKYFDLSRFQADYAYTVDGQKKGEIAGENFNAVACNIKIKGKSTHTGSAKNKMKNAANIACEFQSQIPENEIPQTTELEEGFYHLVSLDAKVGYADISYILRDFETKGINRRKSVIEEIAQNLNKKYGDNTIQIEFTEQYHNMKEYLKGREEIIEIVVDASNTIGIKPIFKKVRGGTDRSKSF